MGPGSTETLKALLVEDDETLREVVEYVMRENGCEVSAFGDGESAWTAYQQEGHALAILDWMLPGLDGLELCRRIRESPTGGQTIVVMVTARNQPADLLGALGAGAHDFVAKPFDVDLFEIRLTIAKRRVAEVVARLRAEEALRAAQERETARQIEHARLEGVQLVAREAAHRVNNHLGIAIGSIDLVLAGHPVTPEVRAHLEDAMAGLDEAVADVRKLNEVVRVVPRDTPFGATLDVEESTRPD